MTQLSRVKGRAGGRVECLDLRLQYLDTQRTPASIFILPLKGCCWKNFAVIVVSAENSWGAFRE